MNNLTDDVLIQGITRISNSDRVIKHLEPNVFSHTTISEHDTRRVLYSLALLLELWLKEEK